MFTAAVIKPAETDYTDDISFAAGRALVDNAKDKYVALEALSSGKQTITVNHIDDDGKIVPHTFRLSAQRSR